MSFEFSLMTKADLPRFLQIRNQVKENLHNRTQYSIDEAEAWFETTALLYFLIKMDGYVIGYFRILRTKIHEVEIGMDLDPYFHSLGLAKPIYDKMFAKLFDELRINCFRLRVLKNNRRALNLYLELGFKIIASTGEDLEMFLDIKAWSSIKSQDEFFSNSVIFNAANLDKRYDLIILIFSYNQSKYLHQCVNSIMIQKRNFEPLIVFHDDSSTDNSAEKIIKYCREEPNLFSAIIQKENIFAKNKGAFQSIIENTRGKLYARLDCDDQWLGKDRLQKQYDYLQEHREISLIHGNYVVVEEEKLNVSLFRSSNTNSKKLLLANTVGLPSVMFRKSSLNFPDNFSSITTQDWFAWVLLASAGAVKNFTGAPLALYRKHSSNGYSGSRNSDFYSDVITILTHSVETGNMLRSLVASLILKVRKLSYELDCKIGKREIFTSTCNYLLGFVAGQKSKHIKRLGSQILQYLDEDLSKSLQPIRVIDNIFLRNLKNRNRNRFFFKTHITYPAQIKWFMYYKLRQKNDSMFVVRIQGVRIGALGVRVKDKEFDIYNVIRDETVSNDFARGVMSKHLIGISKALHYMFHRPIYARVLLDNPALTWYTKCGFIVATEEEDHFVLRFDPLEDTTVSPES